MFAMLIAFVGVWLIAYEACAATSTASEDLTELERALYQVGLDLEEDKMVCLARLDACAKQIALRDAPVPIEDAQPNLIALSGAALAGLGVGIATSGAWAEQPRMPVIIGASAFVVGFVAFIFAM